MRRIKGAAPPREGHVLIYQANGSNAKPMAPTCAESSECEPPPPSPHAARRTCMFFFITLDTGPRRPLSLELSDTKVYAPYERVRLGLACMH